jgi:3-hydroxyacyl-[acyl-carrier-protein] dehydratase
MSMPASIAAAKTSGPTREADGSIVFEFRFGAGDPVFAGHFPNRPIVPGVFQLEMARLAAEWALGCRLSVREVCRAKFQRPILPEDNVRLDLKLTEADGMIQARAGFSAGGEPAGETLLTLWRND